MSCFRPFEAFRPESGGPIEWVERRGTVSVWLPCGKCIGCRLDHSVDWSLRIHHEAMCHRENAFLTLTIEDEFYPRSGSLDRRLCQLFLKRLRKRLERDFGVRIRFYLVGEYGDVTGRAHYHCIVFGWFPKDVKLWKGRGDRALFSSPLLDEVWGVGRVLVGQVTFESAQYCAGYVTKKVTGDRAPEHYRFVHPETGEVFEREPEFALMSRRPGIGKPWLEKFGKTDFAARGYLTMRGGARLPAPRYYNDWLEVHYPGLAERFACERELLGYSKREDSSRARLAVREEVAKARKVFYSRRVL